MNKDRWWQLVIGLAPLFLAVLYLWNPWGERSFIFDVLMCGMSVAALFYVGKNVKLALSMCVLYGLCFVIAVVNVLQHHRENIVWAFIFSLFFIGWGVQALRARKQIEPN